MRLRGSGEEALDTMTKEALKAYKKEWNKVHPTYQRDTMRKWRIKNFAKNLYSKSKKSASKRGHEWSLTLEWLLKQLGHGVCARTRLPFVLETGRNPFCPSIDRIDSALGYTEDNAQVVCHIYNLAKSNWDHETVLKMAK